ncbi:MAG: glycosyltransferase family A protein [Nitrospiraceae bacterium]|nr:glycosyltransferase family A protein [Nitrospiraceae bacterium]MDA8089032.1 glycosyltransferase family A protein [Nitrospiraceae bacterium]
MKTEIKYVVISPVRDESAYIEKTIHAVAAQTILPDKWIIINDGSCDNTGEIINEYAKRYPWIYPVHRHDRGFRKAGGGVIESFYDGYTKLALKDWNYIVKLDGDLSFDNDYFEKCFDKFGKSPKLGIGGGVILNVIKGCLKEEPHPLFHVRGATKIYKRECWDAIDGLLKAPGWDTLDEVKASMLGWETRSFTDLKVIHYRPTGTADGTWKGWVKNGLANYISGYHPAFMFFKCIKRVFEKPYLVGAAGLMYGFLSGYIRNVRQVEDRALIAYLRKQQVNRLLLRESIWK